MSIALFFSLFLTACTNIQKPSPEPFIAATAPPAKQEFRWSNGKMPKSFDPARAAAAPETDIANALFEGLTELDPLTLEANPAVAEKWSSSADKRSWTFQLRKTARWSNGERVTAADFVASWHRLPVLGDKVPHRELLNNIPGLKPEKLDVPLSDASPEHNGSNAHPGQPLTGMQVRAENPSGEQPEHPHDETNRAKKTAKTNEPKLTVRALDDFTLQVDLDLPDKDFPKLVATPVFFPVYGDGAEFENDPLDAEIVTNGAFIVTSVGKDQVTLDRSETYWNRSNVSLERVRIISKDTAEAALNAYKSGEVDAVTNADFEPVAVKLLSPYDDFRRAVYGALNLYEFNTANAPFNDRRVREALAIAIDRDRLAEGQLEGTTQPADRFLPFGGGPAATLTFDVRKARELMEKAGYAGGTNFPPVRLVINRNDTQQRIAKTIARMWKQNLNIDTSIITREVSEMESLKATGEYDLMRRGLILPALDEIAVIDALFGDAVKDASLQAALPTPQSTVDPKKSGPSESTEPKTEAETRPSPQQRILTEDEALYHVKAIPLYFPVAYSLIKPYVRGFEMNALGAPAVKYVSIDNSWQAR